MHALLWFIIVGALGLVTYQAVQFYSAKGTVAQRLASAFQNSMTQVINVWGFCLVGVTGVLDSLASFTGAPEFVQAADAVKGVIPPQYHPYIPVVVIAGSYIARQRTLKAT